MNFIYNKEKTITTNIFHDVEVIDDMDFSTSPPLMQ